MRAPPQSPENEPPHRLFRQLRARRRALKIGSSKFAERIALQPAVWNQYETGQTKAIAIWVLERAAHELGLELRLVPMEDGHGI